MPRVPLKGSRSMASRPPQALEPWPPRSGEYSGRAVGRLAGGGRPCHQDVATDPLIERSAPRRARQRTRCEAHAAAPEAHRSRAAIEGRTARRGLSENVTVRVHLPSHGVQVGRAGSNVNVGAPPPPFVGPKRFNTSVRKGFYKVSPLKGQ